jgi:hypothetical protein
MAFYGGGLSLIYFSVEERDFLLRFGGMTHVLLNMYFQDPHLQPEILRQIKADHEQPNRNCLFNMHKLYFECFEKLGLTLDEREIMEKNKSLVVAIWITILSRFKFHISVSDMKYPTVESFLEAYSDIISPDRVATDEILLLWHTANWMKVILSMTAARKSKEVAIQSVTKFLEGWEGT